MQPAGLFGYAAIFDLDEALIDARPAWRYALEEAVISVTGRRVAAGELVDEYRRRPWRHALAVLLAPGEPLDRCEELCQEMYGRSALKRLLVHEGVGMALDALRGDRIEAGAITRLPHREAIRQIESTGLERFLAVLSPTPEGERWAPAARVEECVSYLGTPPARSLFVSPDGTDLEAVAPLGVVAVEAGWATGEASGYPRLERPGDLHPAVAALSRAGR